MADVFWHCHLFLELIDFLSIPPAITFHIRYGARLEMPAREILQLHHLLQADPSYLQDHPTVKQKIPISQKYL